MAAFYHLGAFVAYTWNSLSLKVILAYFILLAFAQIWKRSTKPLHLNKLMVLYNFITSLANGVCCGMLLHTMFNCDRFYSKQRHLGVEAAATLYWLLKIAELLDTVFMVLRDKLRQVSVLHVYHHVSMVLLTDYFCHLAPWPAIAFPVMINSFVHVCLYAYYGLTAAGVCVPAETKQRLTQLQLLQFAVGVVHSAVGVIYHGFCAYSVLYGLTMMALFGNFYVRAYCTRNKRNKVE